MKLQPASILCSLLGIAGGPYGAAAADSGVFFFSGYASVPPGVGQTLTLRSLLVDRPESPPPIRLDFTAQQHTLVIEATLRAIVPNTHLYSDATIAIYSDSITNGTAADYARPDTFTDGELILSGEFDTLGQYLVPPASNFFGHLMWTGGSRLDELAIPPCFLSGTWDESAPGIPVDYNQAWTGELQAIRDAVEPGSWAAVKGLFR